MMLSIFKYQHRRGGGPSILFENPAKGLSGALVALNLGSFLCIMIGVIFTQLRGESCDDPLSAYLTTLAFFALFQSFVFLYISSSNYGSDVIWACITLLLFTMSTIQFLVLSWGTLMISQNLAFLGVYQCIKCMDPITKEERDAYKCLPGDECKVWTRTTSFCPPFDESDIACELDTLCSKTSPYLFWLSLIVTILYMPLMAGTSYILCARFIPSFMSQLRPNTSSSTSK